MFSFLKAKEPPHPTHADLMDALKFNDADLKANREGYLTNVQRSNLRWNQWRQALVTWGIAAFLGFTLMMILRNLTGISDRYGLNIGLFIPPLIFAAMMAGFVWLAFKYQSQTKADLHKGHVAGISGMVRRNSYMVYTGKTAYRVYELHIAGEVFRVSGKVYNAFVDEDSYDIFYAPNTRTLLSAERV
jgi:hypothetical protein